MQEQVLDDDRAAVPKKGWGFIYMITSPSGKKYIGQTRRSMVIRLDQHKRQNGCLAICNAIKKYGLDKMRIQVIESCYIDQLNNSERAHIERVCSISPNGYNLNNGGGCPTVFSEETRLRLGRGMRGKSLSPERREAIRLWRIGKKHTRETLTKIAATSKGRVKTEETRIKLRNALTGRKCTESHKKRSSENRIGKPHPMSEEAKERIRMGLRIYWASRGFPKDKIKSNKIYDHGKGVPLTPEHKKRVSEALKGRRFSESHRKHMSECRIGKPRNAKFYETIARRKLLKYGPGLPFISDGKQADEWEAMGV